MDEELTPWFPTTVSPARPGLYQRDYGPELQRLTAVPDWWDGEQWGIVGIVDGRRVKAMNDMPWRGLVKEPKYA
jgi:hypothetical protein